jgi:hypothetical protein
MKKNKTFINIISGLLFFGLISTTSSCGKEETDPRDEYIGTYDITYNCVGISFHNNGDPYNHDYFFLVEKDEYDDNKLAISGMPGAGSITLNGADFVGNGVTGTFLSNRIIFNSFGYHTSQDCDEDLPVTAYKR